MLYIKIPKDLRDYKQKVWLGRNTEELFWIVLALICGASAFLICFFTIGTQIGSYITMIVAFPIFLCGFIHPQDMTMLEYLKKIIHFYRHKQYLKYDNDCVVEEDDNKENKQGKEKFNKELRKMNENS